MKRIVTIEEYGRTTRVRFYTIRLDGDHLTEVEKFEDRFVDDEDYSDIDIVLKQIAKRGAQRRYFRNERSAEAIPRTTDRTPRLRQYCIRIADNILILGNGCEKTTRTPQESPDCAPKFELMYKLADLITERCKERDIIVLGDELDGDLYFEIDL